MSCTGASQTTHKTANRGAVNRNICDTADGHVHGPNTLFATVRTKRFASKQNWTTNKFKMSNECLKVKTMDDKQCSLLFALCSLLFALFSLLFLRRIVIVGYAIPDVQKINPPTSLVGAKPKVSSLAFTPRSYCRLLSMTRAAPKLHCLISILANQLITKSTWPADFEFSKSCQTINCQVINCQDW